MARERWEILVGGVRLSISTTIEAMRNGIFMLTEDRKKYGLVLGMDVRENAQWPRSGRFRPLVS